MRLSVAIPMYNEELILPELLRRVRGVLGGIPGGPHEIVIVDDGSTDDTAQILRAEAGRDPNIYGVVFSRNFGHQAALTAALDHVTGDAVIVMDGDLQDAPENIPDFLEKHLEGYDVVYARRVRRKEAWWLRLSYHVFYRLIASLSDTRLPLDAGDFGLMSRRVVDEVRAMPEHHRYLRGLRTWVGFRQTGIPIERDERYAGEPKYSPMKLLKLAADGIFSFSTVPLRFATLVGAGAISLSMAYAIYALYVRLVRGQTPQGFTALIIAITFLAGVQLFFMGIIGEYIGRLFEASKARPNYIVAEKFGGVRSGSFHPAEQIRVKAYPERR
jgi:glycosyltransferase involved in cell wall biosynthesis